MNPIDNADQKNFFQWLIAKGIKTSLFTIIIAILYVGFHVLYDYELITGYTDTTTYVVVSSFFQLLFFAVMFKTYQWYRDDQVGITR